MKRISIILMVALVISLALSGCGGDGKKTADTGGNTPVTNTAPQGTIKLGGSEVNFGSSKSGNNMEIPAEFPTDILPVLDDAQIKQIIRNDASRGINITFATDKSLEEAASFYKGVMKDGSNTQEIGGEDSYIIMGVKGDYAVAISIVVTQGDTYVQIDATPEAK